MKKVLVFLIVIITSLNVFSQVIEPSINTSDNFSPPSPDAASLGVYGTVPVGLFTGTPQVSIPIHNYSTKNLNVPISLSYSSNGVKVDEVASWVGINWNLNAGGVITRLTMGQPDLESASFYPENLDEFSQTTVDFIRVSADFTYDSQPDFFNYNFNGRSGKFIIGKDHKFYTVPFEPLRITYDVDENDYFIFTITDVDGVKYIFGGETATEKTKMHTTSYVGSCGRIIDRGVQSAWYLKNIIHPLGDTVTFDYTPYEYSHYIGQSQSYTKKLSEYSDCADAHNQCPSQDESLCRSYQDIDGVQLTRIYSNALGSVEFIANTERIDIPESTTNVGKALSQIEIYNQDYELLKKFDLNYEQSTSTSFMNAIHSTATYLKHRLFLKEVKETGANGSEKGSYFLNYNDINGLAPRLSFSQDHWGYFNGQFNNSFVPENHGYFDIFEYANADREAYFDYAKKGMLKEIIYPTGGSNEFEYEANTVKEITTVTNPITENFQCVGTGLTGLSELQDTVPILYSGDILLQLSVHLDNCSSISYDPLHMVGSVTITRAGEIVFQKTIHAAEPDENDQSNVVELFEFSCEYGNDWDLGDYEINLYATSEYLTSKLSFTYPGSEEYDEPLDVVVGGVRVKNIKNITKDGQELIKKYYYNDYNERDHSSGIRVGAYTGKYYSFSQTENQCYVSNGTTLACAATRCNFVTVHSNNMNNLFLNGNAVCYPQVTESIGENFEGGGTEYYFEIEKDMPGRLLWGENYIPGTPYCNNSWINGEKHVEQKFKIVNDQKIPVQTNNYFYSTQDSNYNYLNGYAVRLNYDPVCLGEANVTCTEELINESQGYYTCTEDHIHIWRYHYENGYSIKCVQEGANNILVSSDYCYEKTEGTVIPFINRIDHYDVMEYSVYSAWRTLDKVTTTNFDQNGENPISNEVNYYYENPDHTLLTKKRVIDSKGDTIYTRYTYPADYSINTSTIQCDEDKTNCYNSCLESFQNMWAICNSDDVVCKNAALDYKMNCESACNDDFNDCLDNIITDPKAKAVKLLDYRHIIGFPLEIINTKITNDEEKLLDAQLRTYKESDDLVVQENIYQLNKDEISLDQFQPSTIGPLNNFVFDETKYRDVLSYEKYDTHGNVLELKKPGNLSVSYIWGYNKQYAIAEIQNAQSDEVFYTSFEEDGIDPSVLGVQDARTGKKVFNGNYTISMNFNLPAKEYIISYWYWDSNMWNNFETSFIPDQGVPAISHNLIDELRIYPSDATISTYTYDPLIGVSSMTDSNGKTTYYEYDDLGRLSKVRNDKKEIIKQVKYNYKK